jgi:hypothetical protein
VSLLRRGPGERNVSAAESVAALTVPVASRFFGDQVPENQDGEVSEFRLLAEGDILRLIDSGGFTHDAACAIAEYFSR